MKKMHALILVLFFCYACAEASPEKKDNKKDKGVWSESTFAGLKLRSVGPAFMSGRIADIAIHPDNNNIWYIAVGSGGVWKTTNSGTTWESIFDGQGSYSIGSIAIDPNNPNIIWVGSGENVGGRHVGYGDGIYRSSDGGKNWTNLGLKKSEHISTIIIHPKDSDTVWVAAQGPLWSKGGERGLYKTTNGGKEWKKVLGDNEWTGVTDIVIDPRDADTLYAATWQRHRTVAAYMGGGPKSGIHRSVDGGNTWEMLEKGLPTGNIGKIGLGISPQNPDVLYAAIELNRRQGAVYRSSNKGASWTKQSDAVSGATGPHYYQELYVSPHAFDRIYLADVRMQVSNDGGKTFTRMSETSKHSDNHALAFRKNDPDYLLVGSDGGLYESFDLTKTWRFISNLPITQFYKIALDDSQPFYTIYGGTQDNNTQGGPSRTNTVQGIENGDWYVTLFGDGHQPATEPGNPDIMYSQWQQGNLVRVDRSSNEFVYIKPQTEPGEALDRFNWDAPVLVSPHNPQTIFFASQRLWRSEDRGDTWTALSDDLTKNQNRTRMPIMDKQWGWNAPWDVYAMSNFNTITSIAESPKVKGLIFVGTDDGLLQITENMGKSWRKVAVTKLPGAPANAYVNDIKADLFDPNKVYVALSNHKYGDFKPYLYSSSDRGKTWQSMAGDLPERHLVWRIVQDHKSPNLFFTGTEFGVFFSVDSGKKWIKLTGDAPTISFRDLAIQRREDDLVAASFGRGIWILDDYSLLRDISQSLLDKEAHLFSARPALWYFERGRLSLNEKKGSQGDGYFTADNPPYGAVLSYYLKEDLVTDAEQRKKSEEKADKKSKNVTFPDWDKLEAERKEPEPKIYLTIFNDKNEVVRKLEGPVKKGLHRIAWDLAHSDKSAIRRNAQAQWMESQGIKALPGAYTAQLSKSYKGKHTLLGKPVNFTVKQLYQSALPKASVQAAWAFWQEIETFNKSYSANAALLTTLKERLKFIAQAIQRTPSTPGTLEKELTESRLLLQKIDRKLNGNQSKKAIGEPELPAIQDRLFYLSLGTQYSSYGPTPTHKRGLDIVKEELKQIKNDIQLLKEQKLPALEKKIHEAGGPWFPGSSASY